MHNLVKGKTCFKSSEGKCIDLILSNRHHSFKHTGTIETGLSDHHLLIYTMLKSTFVKTDQQKITYRCYKNFNNEAFLNHLNENLYSTQTGIYAAFQETFVRTLNIHAPLKVKIVRGNNKPYMNKTLRKAIMLRSRLKNKANKSKNLVILKIIKSKEIS